MHEQGIEKLQIFTRWTERKMQCEDIADFISDWVNEYHKMEAEGCPYTNIIMAFKVLKAAKLNKMDAKLVLTGVEYDKGKKR